jgi:ubiquinone/menaquinone biosynthesis C-methylase UbiE
MNRYFGLHTLEGEWHALLPRYVLLSERVVGRRVLDIGCGTGIGSSLLLELGAEMVDAIDHRPAVLELGRMKHAKPGLDFHVMFWEELDFPDGTFDVVVCMDPASPVTDPSLLQEVQRVLKPGGEYVCAVERSMLPGIESVLPRYGYAESGEKIDLFRTSPRVPQIGELQEQFKHVQSVVQRPMLTFVFDSGTESGDSVRKVDDGENAGAWIQAAPNADSGRWVPSDHRLCANEAETGAVSIFFCSQEQCPPPPLAEVHLPYYSLVERLGQVINDLQTAPMRELGDDQSVFDELIEPSDERERQPTNEFRTVSWDDQPTSIRARPDFAEMMAATPAPPLVQPPSDSEVNERDLYIEHLVKRIHEWEQRYFEMAQSVDAIVAPGHERVDALEAELHNLRAQQAALFEAVHRQDDLDTGEHARLQKAAPVESPEAEKLGESSEEE